MCKARRMNDQMMCECGLAWDVNDPEPPECPRSRVVKCDGYSTDEGLTTQQILALERRSNMTDDEAIRFARSVESLIKRGDRK